MLCNLFQIKIHAIAHARISSRIYFNKQFVSFALVEYLARSICSGYCFSLFCLTSALPVCFVLIQHISDASTNNRNLF